MKSHRVPRCKCNAGRMLFVQGIEEVLCQASNVTRALAQWRYVDRELGESIVKVLPQLACLTALSGETFVADRNRTSTLITSSEPSLRNILVSSTRSNLLCMLMFISVISSRKRVPAIGLLKKAAMPTMRAAETAFFVSE
jgi:hypothetical protein